MCEPISFRNLREQVFVKNDELCRLSRDITATVKRNGDSLKEISLKEPIDNKEKV